jgi:hypothetical protein
MAHWRPGVVVASPQRRLRPSGILTYLLAAIDGAAGGRRRSGAWPSASTTVARAGHGQSNLHDGAQQRLVSLALRLRGAAAAIPPEQDEVHQELTSVGSDLDEVLGELCKLSRGIHPAIPSEGGLGPALWTLARRSSVPVGLQVGTQGRLPERVDRGARRRLGPQRPREHQ